MIPHSTDLCGKGLVTAVLGEVNWERGVNALPVYGGSGQAR
jgi:hypothetical protein